MKNFLIQTMNGEVKHDFCFHLVEAIRHNNWFYNEQIYDVKFSDTITKEQNYIPVGSLEFVFQYLKDNFNVNNVKPINIPTELFNSYFLKRKASIVSKENMILKNEIFVKSNTQYKAFIDIVDDASVLPDDEYFVSEVIDIYSEWRTFIHHGEIVGLQHYLGDFTLFPDVKFIKEAVSKYRQCPPSYTLDIGINKSGNFIIEVHPFISCGLYGFSDYKRLPLMFIDAFNYIKRR